MYRKIHFDPARRVTVRIDGRAVEAEVGEPLAAVFHRLGEPVRQHPLTGAPRGAYCMMGVCFECLVTLDDGASAQACLLPVREGLSVTRQTGVRSVGPG